MPIVSPSSTLASLTTGQPAPLPNFLRTVPSDRLQMQVRRNYRQTGTRQACSQTSVMSLEMMTNNDDDDPVHHNDEDYKYHKLWWWR